jgi:DNA modification methylase
VTAVHDMAPRLYHTEHGVEIWHGDARAWIVGRNPRDFAALVTDPPYGISYSSGMANARPGIVGDEDLSLRDDLLAWWGEGPALVFGSRRKPLPEGTRMVLTWDKGDAVGMGDLSIPWKPCTEEIYVLGRGFVGRRESCVLSFRPPPANQISARRRQHAHEKPVPLMTHLLARCPAGTILDPCAGSGSTLVAARELGRAAVGVEIEERYCEIIADRLRQGMLL